MGASLDADNLGRAREQQGASSRKRARDDSTALASTRKRARHAESVLVRASKAVEYERAAHDEIYALLIADRPAALLSHVSGAIGYLHQVWPGSNHANTWSVRATEIMDWLRGPPPEDADAALVCRRAFFLAALALLPDVARHFSPADGPPRVAVPHLFETWRARNLKEHMESWINNRIDEREFVAACAASYIATVGVWRPFKPVAPSLALL